MDEPSSTTIIRAWNAEGYHRDILVIDSRQVRMHSQGVSEPSAHQVVARDGLSMVINPKEFPEAVEFEVIIERW